MRQVVRRCIDSDVNELKVKIDDAEKVTKIPTRNPRIRSIYIVQFLMVPTLKYLNNIAVK